jgi:hypothetical protein
LDGLGGRKIRVAGEKPATLGLIKLQVMETVYDATVAQLLQQYSMIRLRKKP